MYQLKEALFGVENQDNFSICMKVEPVNMLTFDSYGIYVNTEKRTIYTQLKAGIDDNTLQSGMEEVLDFENPEQKVKNRDLYFKVTREGDNLNTYFSDDGNTYKKNGSYQLEEDEQISVQIDTKSFWNKGFSLKVSNILVD